MIRKLKQPTATSLVLEMLRRCDDLVNQRQLRVLLPELTPNQISAALYEMRKHEAVDVIVEPDGTGWWFANPRHMDKRMYHVHERTPENGRRRPRKKKGDSLKE